MRSLRSVLASFCALVLVASSCGDGSPTTETTAVETLAAALSSAAQVDSYRIEVAVGNDISSSALGIDSLVELDPDNPATVAVVTPEGVHTTIDIGASLGPLGEGLASPIVLEMWTVGERMIMDTTSYDQLVDLNPLVDLGPFLPGVFSIDPSALTDLDGDGAVVTALGGQSVDLSALAEALPLELADIEPLDESGTYRGTTSMAGILRALGANVEATAAGTAAGLTLLGDVDGAALTQAYVDFYESTEVEVLVVIERGLLSTLEYEFDIGGVYDYLFADGRAEEIFGVSPGEAEQARQAFADTEWIQSSLTTFIVDDAAEIDPPTATEDRTDEFVEFLVASGAFD